jgi:hypothetical protein
MPSAAQGLRVFYQGLRHIEVAYRVYSNNQLDELAALLS